MGSQSAVELMRATLLFAAIIAQQKQRVIDFVAKASRTDKDTEDFKTLWADLDTDFKEFALATEAASNKFNENYPLVVDWLGTGEEEVRGPIEQVIKRTRITLEKINQEMEGADKMRDFIDLTYREDGIQKPDYVRAAEIAFDAARSTQNRLWFDLGAFVEALEGKLDQDVN